MSLWFLVHHRYWILTGAPLRYPVAVMRNGDLTGIILQDQCLYELQQVLDGIDDWVGQPKA